jgi:hypothetical protein
MTGKIKVDVKKHITNNNIHYSLYLNIYNDYYIDNGYLEVHLPIMDIAGN